MEKDKIVQRKNENKSLSFEKTNNIDKPLARLSKRKNRSRWMKVEMKRQTFLTDTNKIQKITKTYLKTFYSTKLETPREIDEFLRAYGLPKLNQNEINSASSHYKQRAWIGN